MQRDAAELLDSSASTVAVRAAESCGGSALAMAGGALQATAHWWSSGNGEGGGRPDRCREHHGCLVVVPWCPTRRIGGDQCELDRRR
jgi:hypothetical protein